MRPSRPMAGHLCRALALLTAALLAGGAAMASPGRVASPIAVAPTAVGLLDVRFGGDATTTRVVLDLDASVAGRIVADGAAPNQVILALPPLLSAGRLSGSGHGLVAGWMLRDDGHGARLVLTVTPGAVASHRFLIPPATEGGHWRYVIDIQDSDPLAVLVQAAAGPVRVKPAADAARPAAIATASTGGGVIRVANTVRTGPLAVAPPPRAPAPAAGLDLERETIDDSDEAPAALPATPPRPAGAAATLRTPPAAPFRAVATARVPARNPAGRGLKVIVVDAGHGGHDPGARSLVRNEKDVTLAAALALRARLEKLGRYRVVLTRDTDVFIPLEERVKIARRAGADLFISLHADSAGADPTPHGASVYTLSDSGQNRVNYVLGPHEWFGAAGDHRADAGVRQILLDLTQRSTRNRSSQFASLLISHIGDRVDLLPRSHRDAGYFVLLAPDVPAVLLEMGFITNPADQMRLTDPAQREQLMGGVADAIDAYFYGETRLARG